MIANSVQLMSLEVAHVEAIASSGSEPAPPIPQSERGTAR